MNQYLWVDSEYKDNFERIKVSSKNATPRKWKLSFHSVVEFGVPLISQFISPALGAIISLVFSSI
jgi:hypothetical protein